MEKFNKNIRVGNRFKYKKTGEVGEVVRVYSDKFVIEYQSDYTIESQIDYDQSKLEWVE